MDFSDRDATVAVPYTAWGTSTWFFFFLWLLVKDNWGKCCLLKSTWRIFSTGKTQTSLLLPSYLLSYFWGDEFIKKSRGFCAHGGQRLKIIRRDQFFLKGFGNSGIFEVSQRYGWINIFAWWLFSLSLTSSIISDGTRNTFSSHSLALTLC